MWQEKGRQAVRDAGGIPALIAVLRSSDARAAARAAGALHNLSCDQASVRAIRKCDGLQPLIDLLRCRLIPRACTCLMMSEADTTRKPFHARRCGMGRSKAPDSAAGSAAGALQNLSREPASRQAILQQGAVEPLTELLAASQLQVRSTSCHLCLCMQLSLAYDPPFHAVAFHCRCRCARRVHC
jgi:hypothetical protein